MIITIDGPVASGKSTVARALARRFNITYLHTGLLYRAVAYILTHDYKKDVNNLESLQNQDLLFISNIIYDLSTETPRILYNNIDITNKLSTNALGQIASIISAQPAVRRALLPLQRAITRITNLIADGRDCGSVVFPSAERKFYLTADAPIRAQRLLGDSQRDISPQDVLAELASRDKRDQERTAAPLTITQDAIVIDNSELTFKETVDLMAFYIAVPKNAQGLTH